MSEMSEMSKMSEINEEVINATKINQEENHEDDNVLVTKNDLKETNSETTENEYKDDKASFSLWDDNDRLSKLHDQMQKISKLRIKNNKFPEEVILKAIAEVLAELGWFDYASFNKTVNNILEGHNIPFALKTRNKRTGKMDFWLIRVFINVGGDFKEYEHGTDKYNKCDVLMSQQFCDYLRDFCRTKLRDEAQFWTFTGSYKNKQHLDISKLSNIDMQTLEENVSETDPNKLVMFQFKKKAPEVYIGKKRN